MRDYYLCYPAILTNTLVPQPGLPSILQNQLGVALDALTVRNQFRVWHELVLREHHKACRRSYISLSGPTGPNFSGLVPDLYVNDMRTLNTAGPHVILMVVVWFATHSFKMNRQVVVWSCRGCHS